MAFHFYKDTITSANELQVEISPELSKTLDESLDSCSLKLKANNIALPIAPMTKIIMTNDNNIVAIYYVVLDSVEIFSKKPLTYKHTLTLSQNTRKLSKHLLRNSVFSQPAQRYKKAYYSISNHHLDGQGEFINFTDGDGNIMKWKESVTLATNEKVLSAYVKYYAYVVDANNHITKVDFSDEIYFPTGARLSFNFKINNITTNITLSGRNAFADKRLLIDNATFNNLFSFGSNAGATIEVSLADNIVFQGNGQTDKVCNIQVELFLETYYYTMYDILDLINKEYRQETQYSNKGNLYLIPTRQQNEELYDLLTNTIAPNFTFTQCTIFQALQDVFNYFDATFTIDENNYIDIEYFNDRANARTINANNIVGTASSQTEEYFNNGLVTYYQDARKVIDFPTQSNDNVKVNAFAPIRSLSVGIPSKNDFAFIVDNNIDNVNYLSTIVNYCNIDGAGSNLGIVINQTFELDISRYCLESSVYESLPIIDIRNTSSDLSTITNQNGCIYYSKNTKNINISIYNQTSNQLTFANYDIVVNLALHRFFGLNYRLSTPYLDTANYRPSPSSAYNLANSDGFAFMRLRTQYIATFDGRLKIESIENKYNGEYLTNQYNGAVDLEKLGVNILGVSLKTGVETLSITYKISQWSDRIKKGDIFTYNSNLYVANVVSYTILDNSNIVCNVALSKNYNELNRRIKIDNEKRLSNISSSLTQKCEDNFVEYIYFSSAVLGTIGSQVAINTTPQTASILSTFGVTTSNNVTNYKIDFAYLNISAISSQLEPYQYNQYVYIPMRKYASGNVACLEMSYDSPISAGNKLVYESGYYSRACFYANKYGFCDTMDISFGSFSDNLAYNLESNYPALTNNNYSNVGGFQLKYYKKPNEIFALNYELVFMTYFKNDEFIGSELVKNYSFITNIANDKKLYIYYTDVNSDFQYSVLDTKCEGTQVELTSIAKIQNYKAIRFTYANSIKMKTWAIGDSERNLYFSSNRADGVATTTKDLYFSYTHNRV